MPDLRIAFDDLDYAFPGAPADQAIFRQFSGEMTLSSEEATALAGPNGIGKTVLAKLIAGHLHPSPRHREKIKIYHDGQLLRDPRILYLPQYLSLGFDRLAGDLFRSMASVGHRACPSGLHVRLREHGITWSDLTTACDKIGKESLLKGVLAAASVSQAPLVILDEPLAQLDAAAAIRIDSLLTEFGRKYGKALMIIAHPHQSPSTATYLRLDRAPDGSKELKPGQPPPPKKGALPCVGRTPAFTVSCWGPVDREFELCPGEVNLLKVPAGLAPGRMGSLIARAFQTKRRARDRGWAIEVRHASTERKAWPRNVKFLPSDAQTTVVPDDMSLAEAALYDRWEEAPRTPVRGALDRHRLVRSLYDEGRHFFPVDPEEPTTKGRELSGGNRQMLALRTIAYPLPDLLVVPLLYSGLDEKNVLKVTHFLEFAALSGTIVIAVDTEV